MADDLSNYKLQLQQVEVALLTDPDNSELLKLKDDIGKSEKSNRTIQENIKELVYLSFRSINNTAKGIDQNPRSRAAEICGAIEFSWCRKSRLLQRSESKEPVVKNMESRRKVHGKRCQRTVSL